MLSIEHPAQDETASGSQLIDLMLREQHELTAVERFARHHESQKIPAHGPYRELIPLTSPQPGQQYGFEVDLDACSGCKACVTACHAMNGLDDDEVWRTVGLIQGGTKAQPFFQMVTSACHHCAHPACMTGCPVQAYEKDRFTGIVKHLDDQCIGCQYCVLKCPYDVPKYNSARGIVRKCDMCSSRLAEQEAPACVQACPSQAIRITVVDLSDVAKRAEQNTFLPGAPAPAYTHPTTIYKKKLPLPPNSLAADDLRVRPEHAHFPLVVMLVLTQLSLGMFFVEAAGMRLIAAKDHPLVAALAFGVANLGLFAAIFHLGRPLYAFRAFLGFRTSWMSREIIAFSAFMAAAGGYVSALWAPSFGIAVPSSAVSISRDAMLFFGALGVFSSMMIYIDTQRVFWKALRTVPSFLLTGMWLGPAAVLLFNFIQASRNNTTDVPGLRILCGCIVVSALVKISWEMLLFRHIKRTSKHPLRKSAVLLVRDLGVATTLRFALGLAGGVIAPSLMLLQHSGAGAGMNLLFAAFIFGSSFISELLERLLYFKAVVALKMPGGLSA